MEKLSLIGEAKPIVRRNGVDVEVSADDIVLDDLVVLATGDQIVVDGEVLLAAGLEADESLLTGEADPVHKHVGDEVMSGSFVVAGGGVMRATKVGLDSYATKLTSEAKTFSTTKSELMGSIMRFCPHDYMGAYSAWHLVVHLAAPVRPDVEEALSGTVAGIVTMVPEGLRAPPALPWPLRSSGSGGSGRWSRNAGPLKCWLASTLSASTRRNPHRTRNGRQ